MKRRRSSVPREATRAIFIAGVVLAAFCVVFANQLRVQTFARDEIFRKADELGRMVQSDRIAARRGRILSADGRLIAASASKFRLGIDPGATSLSPALTHELSLATGIPAAELLDFVSRSKSADDWGTLIDSAQAAEVNRIRSRYSADFVWTRPAKEREYALGEYFAPVVGFVEKGEGRTGIEKWLNHALQGREGLIAGVKDGDGRFLPWLMRKTNSRPVLDGDDVVLTIDPDLQVAAMESLARATETHRADHGVAIVMDPHTGDVLAIATAPSFDPEDPFPAFAEFASGKRSSPEINPAVSFMFEPGSIFKMFTIALGLEAGVIRNGETIRCTGSKDFSVKTMSCAGDSGPKAHGIVGIEKSLEVSCNISAATWGVRIGFDRYYATVEKLGLLQASGISLSPESRGIMRKNDANRTIQMANVGFGQSVTGTPIGLASAFTCFANDGVRVAPRLVKRIGETEQPASGSARVFSREVANQLLEMSERVIESPTGTGYALRIPGYTLAGKTGTAQKRDPKTGLVRSGMYISSFVGYFPAKNPRAVVLVMIDNPKGGHYYGGKVAGPVYQEIVQFLIRKWKVPPDRPTEAVDAAQ